MEDFTINRTVRSVQRRGEREWCHGRQRGVDRGTKQRRVASLAQKIAKKESGKRSARTAARSASVSMPVPHTTEKLPFAFSSCVTLGERFFGISVSWIWRGMRDRARLSFISWVWTSVRLSVLACRKQLHPMPSGLYPVRRLFSMRARQATAWLHWRLFVAMHLTAINPHTKRQRRTEAQG